MIMKPFEVTELKQVRQAHPGHWTFKAKENLTEKLDNGEPYVVGEKTHTGHLYS